MSAAMGPAVAEQWRLAAKNVYFGSHTAVVTRDDLGLTAAQTVAMLADLARSAADICALARDEQQRVLNEVLDLKAAVELDETGGTA